VERLRDIIDAIGAIRQHLARGELSDALIYDAVRMRLVEIGEAVKDIDEATLAFEVLIPWSSIAGMRDRLTHHYFDTSVEIVQATVRDEIPLLDAAVRRLVDIGPRWVKVAHLQHVGNWDLRMRRLKSRTEAISIERNLRLQHSQGFVPWVSKTQSLIRLINVSA
jgi:uncharacterized protein with HEPN domain